MKRRINEGFTLIELLIVIVILILVFVIGFILINNLITNSDGVVDDITEKMILDASEEYAIEYRDSDRWKEENKDNKTSYFCISLQSLINYGYFKNNEEQINKYKNNYIVTMTVENGIYSYELVHIDGVNHNDNICNYYQKVTNIESNDRNGDFVLKEGGKTSELGNVSYSLDKEKEFIYNLNLNYNMEFKVEELITPIPTYVFVVMDNSGSMLRDNRFDYARNAAINLSDTIIKNIDSSMVSLIQYDYYPFVKVPFRSSRFLPSDFKEPKSSNPGEAGNTNTSGGLDLVSSILYNSRKNGSIPTDSNIYTILIYDGTPVLYSYLNYNGKTSYPSSFSSENEKKYYLTNFYNDSNNFNECCDGTIADSVNCIPYVEKSSSVLKSLGSKLIVVGYEFDNGFTNLKKIATNDTNLCRNTSLTGYCYYDSNIDNINDLFSNISTQIKQDVKSTDVSNIKIVLTPVNYNGKKVFDVYKDNVEVDSIVQEVDLSSINETITINKESNYKISINEELFEDCQGDCTLEVKLFDIEIRLDYDDNSKDKTIKISDDEIPVITLSSNKVVILN